MKKLTLSVMLLLSLCTFAQNKQITDSLNAKIGKTSDTALIILYNQLSWEYRNADLNKADSFANLAISLSLKKNYSKGIGNA